VSGVVPVVVVQATRRPRQDLAAQLDASGEVLVVATTQDVAAAARSASNRGARAVLLVADDASASSHVASLMQLVRVPVVAMTQSTAGVLAAIAAGAVEGLLADAPVPRIVESLKLMSEVRVVRRFPALQRPPSRPSVMQAATASSGLPRLVAIGASTGGPAALAELLGLLPSGFPAAVVIAQHMPSDYDAPFARWLSEVTKLEAKVSDDGEPPRAGKAYIPRGGHDLVVGPTGLLQNVVPRGKGPVPSVDRLLESAARLSGFALFGIVLTGMGRDGMHGLKAMRLAGAVTMTQDKESSVISSMPEAAMEHGGAHVALPPAFIAQQLLAWVGAWGS
jgi:two-component system chemotaxis response regulator CheB